MRKRNLFWRTFIVVFFLGLIPGFTPPMQAQNGQGTPDGSFNLTDDVIKERVEMYMLKNYKENHDDIVIECDAMPTPIPVDPIDWEVSVNAKYGTIKNGANLIEVTVYSKKEIYKKFITTARLRTFDDVVVTKRMLNRGEQIGEDDVTLERIETTNMQRGYFADVNDVIHQQTRKVISAGKPIFVGMVELPDLIKRGDVVRIVVRLKNMEVTATGKALESGHKGDKIKVQNVATGKKLSAVIIDEKTVLVEL